MSQQVFSITVKAKTPAVTSLIGVWPQVQHGWRFRPIKIRAEADSVSRLKTARTCSLVVHDAQILYTVSSSLVCDYETWDVFHRGKTVEPLWQH